MPIHPICHKTLHTQFTNTMLAQMERKGTRPHDDPAIARFIAWIADKPPDFHRRTRAKAG